VETTAASVETSAAPETTAPAGDEDLFARGEDLFTVSAGGVGCKTCHGAEARGDVGVGPNIQGKSVNEIKIQLRDNELMEYMRSTLTEEDLEAVALYLAYLKDTYGEA
jgi:mono/diheme cytochrome c family protein